VAAVREVTGDDWAVLRDIRLEALSEAPQVFGSTYEREAGFTERDWRGRISDRSATLLGYAGPVANSPPMLPEGSPGPVAADPAGLAGPGRAADTARPTGLAGVVVEGGTAHLVSMYVRPAGRGSGVAAALVDAAADWARARGYPALFLWVTESNAAARRLYERCGFTPTGDRQPLPSNPAVPEIRMSRAL
jgi:GNAT superfamily N-acetyltransferase